MNNYPDTFVPLEIHTGDGYETDWGNQRKSFYLASATPTVWFDGVTQIVGAGSVQSAYQNYRTAYLNRMSVPSDVTIEMEIYKIDKDSCQLNVKVGIEPGGVGKSMRIQIVQALDNWPASPSYSRNTVKQGTIWPIYATLQPGEFREIPAIFHLDADSLAQPNDVLFVVFAQERVSNAPAEVYNAAFQYGPFDFRIGDMNCDALVDFADINPFVLALTNPAGYTAGFPDCELMNADINQDGLVDFGDINPFVDLLTSP